MIPITGTGSETLIEITLEFIASPDIGKHNNPCNESNGFQGIDQLINP